MPGGSRRRQRLHPFDDQTGGGSRSHGDDERGAAFELDERERRHPPERHGASGITPQVGEEHVLQRRQHETTGPQGPGQRVRRTGLDQLGSSGDDAGLRAAEQLVPAEGHEGGPGGEGLAGGRLALQPRRRTGLQPRAGGVQQARADVGDDGHRAGKGGQAAVVVSSTKPSTR